MSALSLASIFTGAVIFVWGLRATRNGRVKVLYFQMRSRLATLIFGLVASLCGILMIITGVADASELTCSTRDTFTHTALYGFATGWTISLLIEGLARVGWRVAPSHAPEDIQRRRQEARWKKGKGRKRSAPEASDECAISSHGESFENVCDERMQH